MYPPVQSSSSFSGAQWNIPDLSRNIQQAIDTRFKELNIPQNDQDYLHLRFKNESEKLLDLLNCLDASGLDELNSPNANENISNNFNLVNGVRLGKILVETAKYDCGKKQLIQLTDELKTENIKLKIIQPRTSQAGIDEYAFKSNYSLMNQQNPVIYISVQPEQPILGKRCIGTYRNETQKLDIKLWSENELFQAHKDALEGYKFGHEISHAIAFVRFHKEHYPRSEGVDVYNNWNNLHKSWVDIISPKNYTQDYSIYKNLFENPEEYRNLLGLGIDKTFGNTDENIIGEFDYLNEVMKKHLGYDENSMYVRIPYNTNYQPDQEAMQIAKDICRKKHEQLYGASETASCGCFPNNCVIC
ncbi:MAG: hypothetical protein ACLRFH_00495 [Opitutales bacterium]